MHVDDGKANVDSIHDDVEGMWRPVAMMQCAVTGTGLPIKQASQ